MHRYCSACNGSAAYLDLSAFRSVPRVLKQAICFVGWDRYKALGSMSDMGIFANDAPNPLQSRTSPVRLEAVRLGGVE